MIEYIPDYNAVVKIAKIEYENGNKIKNIRLCKYIQQNTYKMSVRFIGFQSYVPQTPGNYAKGKTKVIRISTLPNEHEQKVNRMHQYKEELDKQVEQIRKRKLEAKQKQLQEDARRQKLFYQSLEVAKRHNNHSPPKNSQNFHILHHDRKRMAENNPEDDRLDDSEDNFHFQSRLAHIGKHKIKLDVPVFQSRGDLVYEEENYNDMNMERRRRLFIDQMDRTLLDAHMSIERSRNLSSLDEELDRLKRRLRTDESRLITEIQYNENEHMYNLPYRSHLYNSSNRYRHRRQMSSM